MPEDLIIAIALIVYLASLLLTSFYVIKEHRRGNKKPKKNFIKFLAYSHGILTPLVIGFFVLSRTNYLDYEPPLTFDKYDQITFENFRGFEFFKKTLYGNKRFAYIVTTIDTKFDDNSVTVRSLFHPSRSFVYKKNTNSKELLTHEKYHFKITELYVRKAKKKISSLKSYDKNRIRDIISETKDQEQDLQSEYDYNTFHGYVLGEQKRYEREIDSLLYILSEYSKPKIQFYAEN